MKIEKMNDHQIRCTLTQEDLEERQIKLSELAYGSEKANRLFHDMMEQANREFGFDVDNIPIMVEAVPLPGDQIMLLITKVDSPEELDTRFSNFTSAGKEPEDGFPIDQLSGSVVEDAAKELMDLFDRFGKGAGKEKTEQPEAADAKDEKADMETQPETSEETASDVSEMVRIFTASSLEQVIGVAASLRGVELGENVLYKNTATGVFYLVLFQGNMDGLDFKRISFKIAAHLHAHKYTPAILANICEHYKVIVQEGALQMLSELN